MAYKRTTRGTLVKVVRAETDPIALRLSVGGTKLTGYYFVYRANYEKEIREMLMDCLEAFDAHIKDKNN